MTSPTIATSLRLGLRAAAREGWLLPVAALVALVRSVATLPAVAVAAALVIEGAGAAARLHPFSLVAPLRGAAAVFGSPRFLALVGGLWLAGSVLAGLLRVLLLSGVLPTLGASAAGTDASGRFAPGVAWGFPRQLATWLLSLLADAVVLGYLAVVAVAAARVAGGPGRAVHPVLLAGSAALALVVGLLGLAASRVLGDAAAARAALLDEAAPRAFAGATRRLLARPGTFVLAGLGLAFAGAAVGAVLQPATAAVAALSGRVSGAVLLGPQLMLALLGVLATAAIDLGWLATVSVLACGRDGAGAGPRVSA